MLSILYWVAFAMIAYMLLLFPLLTWVRSLLFRRPFQTANDTPSVSVVIAAYNEAGTICDRIANLRQLDYPQNCVEIIIASDGSTDRTIEEIAELNDDRVKVLDLPRGGKGAALNRAVRQAESDILVFSDANTVFDADALRQLVAPFADPQVGGVAGNQIYGNDDGKSMTGEGEKSYWSFDRALKTWQSRAGSVTSATGAIYAIRRALYQPVPPDCMDDFYISTGVISQGQRLVFAPNAIAREPVATKAKVEFSRKVRIITQGLRAVWATRSLFNPFRYGSYSLQLFTHKVLRRLFAIPLCVMAVTAPLLWREGTFFQVATTVQIAFCAFAAIGTLAARFGCKPFKLFAIPHFVFLVGMAAVVSLGNLIIGRTIRRWEPERHQGKAAVAAPLPLQGKGLS